MITPNRPGDTYYGVVEEAHTWCVATQVQSGFKLLYVSTPRILRETKLATQAVYTERWEECTERLIEEVC